MIYRSESLRWAIAVYPQLTYEQLEYLHGLMVEVIPAAVVSHDMPSFDVCEGVWFWPFYELPAGSDDNATATRERELIPVSYEEYECWLELAEEQTATKYGLSLVSFEG